MATEQTFVLRGHTVRVREGDLLVSRCNTWWSLAVAAINMGYSHATTAVNVNGRLVAVGILPGPWTDATGRIWQGGITVEPIELYEDPVYTRLWITRPRQSYSAEQIAHLRFAVAEQMARDTGDGTLYDDAAEFYHSMCGYMPATTNRFLRRARGGLRTKLRRPRVARRANNQRVHPATYAHNRRDGFRLLR